MESYFFRTSFMALIWVVISSLAVLYLEIARVSSCWLERVILTTDSGRISAGIWSPRICSRLRTDSIPSIDSRSLVRLRILSVSRLASVKIMWTLLRPNSSFNLRLATAKSISEGREREIS